MQGTTRVAARYARSLVELAKEKGVLEQVEKDMELFVKVANENPQFGLVLKNPIIGHDKKLSILNSLFKGRVNDITFAIFNIVTRKNREAHLVYIASEFINQYRILQGIELAQVTTTSPLTDVQKNDFRTLIGKTEKKKIELKEVIDKSIIGGYVLKIGDRQIDESIKAKLQKLKSKFKDNPYISKL